MSAAHLSGQFPSLIRGGHCALIDLQAEPLLVPARAKLRPDHALLVADANPTPAVLDFNAGLPQLTRSHPRAWQEA